MQKHLPHPNSLYYSIQPPAKKICLVYFHFYLYPKARTKARNKILKSHSRDFLHLIAWLLTLQISSRPGPVTVHCNRISDLFFHNTQYISGSSPAVLLMSWIPRISQFHPGSHFQNRFCFQANVLPGTCCHFSIDLITYAYRESLSRYPSTSSTVNATSVVPCIRQPYLEATQSNYPILDVRLSRAILPLPSPLRLLQFICFFPKIFADKCAVSYCAGVCFAHCDICLISYGGIPARSLRMPPK